MMLKSLKHISPKTKILFIVFILILLPSAILSYLGLRSIDQSAENIRTKYLGTISLVRDKLEREVIQLEENLRNSLIERFPTITKDDDLQMLLRKAESDNPALNYLFLVNADKGLISASVSLGWQKPRKIQTFRNPQAAANFEMAEKTEFIQKDYVDAIELYKKALSFKTSSQERALLLSRIGRCYFKMGKIKEGINEYKKILKFRNEEVTIGNVPASIVALSQIVDGYRAMNDSKEQYKVIQELYQRLLDYPWDLSGGDYLYYLKSTSREIQSFDPPGSNSNPTEKKY